MKKKVNKKRNLPQSNMIYHRYKIYKFSTEWTNLLKRKIKFTTKWKRNDKQNSPQNEPKQLKQGIKFTTE